MRPERYHGRCAEEHEFIYTEESASSDDLIAHGARWRRERDYLMRAISKHRAAVGQGDDSANEHLWRLLDV